MLNCDDIAGNSVGEIEFDLRILKTQKPSKPKRPIKYLFYSACFFTAVGGVLVSSNTKLTPYGFLFWFISSPQFALSAYLDNDKKGFIYSLTLFFFVDILGVYRWLMN